MNSRSWLVAIACLMLLASGCPADDDDDVSAADDDASGDDDTGDDDVSGDDDTQDDDSTPDDDDSADDDDDSADDDDTAPINTTELLEVHLDNQTLAPVGYREFSLTGTQIPLVGAAAIVTSVAPGSHVDGCTPQATYLNFHWCYAAPAANGGQALIDARTGEPVFIGEIISDGLGQRLFPATLGPAQDLMAHVNPGLYAPQNLDFELLGLEFDVVAMEAFDEVRSIGLAHTFVFGHDYDAFVLLHPYTVGDYEPSHADLIVTLVRY